MFSLLLQLKRFLELQKIIDKLAVNNESLFVSEEEWNEIKVITAILRQPFLVTQMLQKVNVTLSDFYAAWLQLKIYYKSLALKGNELAQCLLEAMNEEKYDHLIENSLMLCSVFLDPRLKGILLKNRDKTLATKLYLMQLWKRHCSFEKARKDVDVHETQEEILTEFDFSLLERHMENVDFSGEEISHENNSTINISALLNEFENVAPVSISISVLKWWEENKHRYPELYALAKIVHAVPASQASCERCFSIVTFVYSRYRTNLTEEHLDAILLTKFNKDLVYLVKQEELDAKAKKQ